MRRHIKRLLSITIILALLLLVVVLSINGYVEQKGEQFILTSNKAPSADAILVLGAYVHPDGGVSLMLNDRLIVARDLYNKGIAKKIIVSGDHGIKSYDEVNTMKSFLMEEGIPSEDIFMDHAGFSTYESIYRARDIFLVEKLIIVTQDYHLKRAVFIARELGLEAYGVAADRHNYGQIMTKYELREKAARNNDFFLAKIIKAEPTFLGEEIPIMGDGRITDDK